MKDRPLGRIFLDSPALSVYGIWVLIFLFPLTLAGTIVLIDARRSIDSLILSSIAFAIFSVSYSIRFYLVRNTESLRVKLLQAEDREQAINIIAGGFWWWLITLTAAIAAVIFCRNLF